MVLPSAFLLVAMLNLTLIVAGLKELILDEMGGTAHDAGLFFSIEMLAYVVFAPLSGLLSDRLGKRRPLIAVGFLGSAALYASYAVVESLPLLLGLRFVQGAFSVLGWSTLMALVLDHSDEARRGRHMGVMGGALILGISLGAPLGGWISSAFGVRAPLELAAVLFLVLAVSSVALAEPARVRARITVGQVLAALTARPRLLLPYGFHFVDRYTVGFFIVLFPLYLETLGTSDPAVRGRYLALYLLPFAVLQYFTGRLSERVGPYLPLLWGSLLYGVVLAGVGWAGLFALWPVMCALGVLASLMFPPTIALTARMADSRTLGSAMGGFNLAGSLGFAIGPLAGAWAYEAGGFGFAFLLAGAMEVAVAVLGFAFLRRWRSRPPGDLPPGVSSDA